MRTGVTPRRTTFLLGAGASWDAHLPLSAELTQKLTEEIDTYRAGEVAQALHVVIGSIIAHETRLGASPYAGVDVERAFSAIKMLSERNRLEVAPFVGNWTDTSLTSRNTLPAFWGKNFKKAMGATFDGDVERQFRSGVLALTSASTGDGIYRSLMREMMNGLVRILMVEDASRFEYLCPIFDVDGVRIATLNYDLGLELAASLRGTKVDTGVENWRGGFDWHWNGEGVPLLKLHGSIDWTVEASSSAADRNQPGFKVPKVLVGDRLPGQQVDPGIIFGAREKLRADGPFLAMLSEFGRWLRDTDDLIVVGYSFRDDHINVSVRDWLGDVTGKTMTIIDPHFPELGNYDPTDPFTQALNRAMHPDGPPREQPDGTRTVGPELADQFKIVRSGAADALPLVCAGVANDQRDPIDPTGRDA